MVVPVVVIGNIVAFGGAFGKTEQVRLAVIPEVVVAEGDVGGLFAVQGTVSLHLVLVGSRIAVEEIVIVHPYILVILLKSNIVAFGAIHVHNAQVANFHILRILDTDAPTVRHGIVTDTFDRHVGLFGTAEINHHVSRFHNGRIGNITDKA